MTPSGAVVSSEMVDRLIADQNLFLAEQRRADAVKLFLIQVRDYKINSQQREALGLPLDPAPVPPAGYTLPVEPPPPPPPPPSFDPIVRPLSRFGIYPAPGDNNTPGTIIANPYVAGKQLIRIAMEGPFGVAHYWEPYPQV